MDTSDLLDILADTIARLTWMKERGNARRETLRRLRRFPDFDEAAEQAFMRRYESTPLRRHVLDDFDPESAAYYLEQEAPEFDRDGWLEGQRQQIGETYIRAVNAALDRLRAEGERRARLSALRYFGITISRKDGTTECLAVLSTDVRRASAKAQSIYGARQIKTIDVDDLGDILATQYEGAAVLNAYP